MDGALVTMVGNAASNVTYRETPGGVSVANFRLAATERRFDRERGDWADGETTWVTVVAWRRLAVNVVSSVNKGDPLVVSGRLRVREWGEGGNRRVEVEIDARSVGHDLARGTSAFRRGVEAKSIAGQEPSAAPPAAAEPPAARSGAGGSRRVRLVEEAVPDWIVEAVAARHRAGAAAAAEGGAAGADEPGGVDVAREVLN